MPARLRCFAAPSRCMASAIWQNRHPLSSAGFACKTSAASALRPILTCQLDSAALQLRLAVWRPPYGKTVIRCLLLASPARHRPPRLSVRSSHASSTPLLCSSVSLYGVRHMAKPSSAVFCRLRLQDIGRRFCRMCGSGITTCKDNLRFPSLLPACSNHGILFCVLL